MAVGGIVTYGLLYSPSLVITLGYESGTAPPPPPPPPPAPPPPAPPPSAAPSPAIIAQPPQATNPLSWVTIPAAAGQPARMLPTTIDIAWYLYLQGILERTGGSMGIDWSAFDPAAYILQQGQPQQIQPDITQPMIFIDFSGETTWQH